MIHRHLPGDGTAYYEKDKGSLTDTMPMEEFQFWGLPTCTVL